MRPIKRARTEDGEHEHGSFTGNGASHGSPKVIPWTDIFKSHLSNLDGHVRMLAMMQQSSAPNTQNWNLITPMVERAKQMLIDAQKVAREFDTSEANNTGPSRPPFHSGRASEATSEAGSFHTASTDLKETKVLPERRKRSLDSASAAPGTTEERSNTGKRRMFPKDQHVNGKQGGVGGPSSMENKENISDAHMHPDTTFNDGANDAKEGLFDSGPRDPQNYAKPHQPFVTTEEEEQSRDIPAQDARPEPKVEYEDISQLVEARLQEKERKRRKKEKKRKRESNDSMIAPVADSVKPLQKRIKQSDEAVREPEPSGGLKRRGSDMTLASNGNGGSGGEPSKRRRRR
ncbi:hypothetical protein L228DRAFT_279699 [Xylona heveae TC161]|uniref:Uncharacterized protein n=1 Tax=Xylona heveae (strain CBS 132557 / TC161) TaxID=1328760 RepID=A0A165JQF6_XYLHT|nr:hypothetical protein L228DRAFT_279699 [Xylona heveae TC161]KZF26511.1 hypothetical protein L228DRAFT_279699 [Xylona heveae TC161]